MTERYTIASIKAICMTWTRDAAANALDGRYRELDRNTQEDFVEKGLISVAVEKYDYWKELCNHDTGEVYASFTAWMNDRKDPSSNWEAYHSVKANIGELSPEDMGEMSRRNQKIMAQAPPEARRDPKIVKAAQEVEAVPLVRTIKREYPAAIIDIKIPLSASVTEGELSDIEQGARDYRIAEQEPAATLGECLAGMAREYSERNKSLVDETKRQPIRERASVN